MYKIAVIGTVDTVKSYRALGLETYTADNDEKARTIFKSLIRAEAHYGIIYIEESFADCLYEEITDLMTSSHITVCVIPGRKGAEGRGVAAIQSSIERAIGADIL